MSDTDFVIDCYFNKIRYNRVEHTFMVNDSDTHGGYDMVTKHSKEYNHDYDTEIMLLSIELTNLCHEIARKKLTVLFKDITVANNKCSFHPLITEECPYEQQPTCELAVSDYFKSDVEENYLQLMLLNRQMKQFGVLLNVREVFINIEDTYYSIVDKATVRDIEDYDWDELKSNTFVNVNGKHGFIHCIENNQIGWSMEYCSGSTPMYLKIEYTDGTSGVAVTNDFNIFERLKALVEPKYKAMFKIVGLTG